MASSPVNPASVQRRRYWLEEIVQTSDNFGTDSTRLQTELAAEVDRDGPSAVIDHLRFCGNIPEG